MFTYWDIMYHYFIGKISIHKNCARSLYFLLGVLIFMFALRISLVDDIMLVRFLIIITLARQYDNVRGHGRRPRHIQIFSENFVLAFSYFTMKVYSTSKIKRIQDMHVVFILGYFSIFKISGREHHSGILVICNGFVLCPTFVDPLPSPKRSGY